VQLPRILVCSLLPYGSVPLNQQRLVTLKQSRLFDTVRAYCLTFAYGAIRDGASGTAGFTTFHGLPRPTHSTFTSSMLYQLG
jgi:hypothetical protein